VPRAAGQNVGPGRYRGRVSRYRLMPSAAQEAVLLGHCAHARYVWNLCVEQDSHWRPGRGPMPGFAGRCRQLSDARAANPWLAGGSVIVQQQAIRDHGQAMANFFAGTFTIAAGHAVTARGGVRDAGPVNREPQPVLLPAAEDRVGIPSLRGGDDVKWASSSAAAVGARCQT